ncbi:MAG: enoyl-CoA hydratase/isomerase family protein [Candidatus Lokiarchaeota archaeon]|nr:enoyl-CoA hydratase/isomerase family protein [Candidatus Lokiarchaeota archaeon]
MTFELKENGLGILTLNRTDRLNAISFKMTEELHELFDHLMVNLDCRVVIMKGAGDRAFSAGLDLKESSILAMKKKPEAFKQFYYLDVPEVVKSQMYFQWRISQIIVKMRKISQPIIALIQGAASGGGFAFCMASDVRIASKNARFNNAFIKIGVSGADLASSYFLPRLIGLSRAAEILYTGRFFGAEEAEKIGFVLKVVDDDKLLDAGIELAKEMLNKSPLGLRMTKEAINLSLDAPSLETMIQLENRTQVLCTTSKDAIEGVTSFFEKKEPKYPNR